MVLRGIQKTLTDVTNGHAIVHLGQIRMPLREVLMQGRRSNGEILKSQTVLYFLHVTVGNVVVNGRGKDSVTIQGFNRD